MDYTELKWHRVRRHFAAMSETAVWVNKPLLILAITDHTQPPNPGDLEVASTHLIRIPFEDCTPQLIKILSPDFIVTPLASNGFDCYEVAQLIDASDYQGRMRIMTNQRVDEATITTDIGDMCNGLDVAVVRLGRGFIGNID